MLYVLYTSYIFESSVKSLSTYLLNNASDSDEYIVGERALNNDWPAGLDYYRSAVYIVCRRSQNLPKY